MRCEQKLKISFFFAIHASRSTGTGEVSLVTIGELV